MKLFKKLSLLFAALALTITIAACDLESDEDWDTELETIVLGEGDWLSNEFHNQVAKFIIENGYEGYEVEVSVIDTPLLIQSLRGGSVHANLEMWSDNMPSYQDDLAEGYYEEVSINFDDNFQGLYIPQYLQDANPGLQTIQDLPDYKHLFPDPEISNWHEDSHKGIIIGGPSGWAVTDFLERKFSNEDLYPGLVEHFEFRTSESTTLLNTTLMSAYDNEEPWAGYHWEPTYIMGLLDMVLLEDDLDHDTDTGAGNPPPQNVTVVVTGGFGDEFPDLYAFLSNYETSSPITSDALAYMTEEEASSEETAKWWLAENTDIWGDWVPEEVFNNIMDALNE